MLKNFFYLSLLILVVWGCKSETQKNESQPVTNDVQTSENVIADTIIYEVIIKNADPEDYWEAEKLQNLDRKKLVDDIFQAVYNEKAIAYDYLTEEKLGINKVKALENSEEFSRENVGSLQFYEKWQFNSESMKFDKTIYSMVVGYETYDSQGELRGYKAAFRIDLLQ